MKIGGTNISSFDLPGKMALVIFTGGCTLRCPYCHNPEIIDGGDEVKLEEVFKKIEDASEFVDGVVITGGEPLMQCQDIKKILKYVHSQGLLAKLDTNGCFPERLQHIIELVDYVSLDIKAPFDRYEDLIGSDIGKEVEKSMEIVLNSPNTFLECRTTYVPTLLNEKDIYQISREINCDLYTLQQFRNRIVLDPSLESIPSPSREFLEELAKKIKPLLNKVKIKTSEFGEETI
ncbi:MAG: anaerobic ribonucleoside-triphosphate reductase activating protein [Euryarchaeota archaeon]|nr:anaerobic ribonucleoside-triphosphate reductase activating protein [Euryarchaeota archaeon]MBV1730515.1 anaerobic ribonucleoside-triphosphate reductase activating protein [Methanobacterium sp.]MBU4548316.1 anaerobic ribonucleoside-triphosphate reductase activating protein [Euryarchaeota archaeon]MBU4606972.1 anaerobic ribonucleoside-triphosphate reductase activating protein [Euryarchaeota archaeon]MBV1754812.1 anaerobic ribonucleoside-triphosphate reductase activating protein [Methanobacteri